MFSRGEITHEGFPHLLQEKLTVSKQLTKNGWKSRTDIFPGKKNVSGQNKYKTSDATDGNRDEGREEWSGRQPVRMRCD